MTWSRTRDLVAGDCTHSTGDWQSRSNLIQTFQTSQAPRFSVIVWLIASTRNNTLARLAYLDCIWAARRTAFFPNKRRESLNAIPLVACFRLVVWEMCRAEKSRGSYIGSEPRRVIARATQIRDFLGWQVNTRPLLNALNYRPSWNKMCCDPSAPRRDT